MNVYKNVIADVNGCDVVSIEEGEHQNRVNFGDLLFTQSSETLEEVGLTSVWLNDDTPLLNSFCFGFHFDSSSLINPRFAAYSMRTPYARKRITREGQGATRYNLSSNRLKKVKILYPSHSEQDKIAGLLSLLETRIEKQCEIIDQFKKYKRGVIQHIFRRSHGQTESQQWQQVRLGDIFKKVSRRNTDGKIKNVITNSAEYGLIPQRDFFDKDIAIEGNTENYYVIENGDFVYNPRKSITAPYGPFNRYTLKDQGIISPLYTCLVLKVNINPSYLAWYFKSDAWHRYIYDNGSQGVRHDRVSMTDDLLMGIPVIFPDRTTQDSIANALDLVENRLHLAQNKMDLLNMTRKGFMQQLFI